MKKEKITLKNLSTSDARRLSELLNASKDVCLTLDIPYPQNIAQQKKHLTLVGQLQKIGTQKHFTIWHNNDLIGMISFKNVNHVDRYAEVGYWMSSEYKNSGYMTQALKQITRYGFSKLRLHKIYAHVCVENLASMRVLEKCGYMKEATLRKHKKWKGRKWADMDVYSKVK